ncbi:MAG: enoyl-[acyl-carrier-protein] reductase FabK [Clostridium sp.]|nr:enoyl-[acyl-carrier-protein] reductase FabK [Clostridium sp.]MDU7085822.1 enoyl-[acyl-carrier-protein] reductase FabK [Clostridium sp.]
MFKSDICEALGIKYPIIQGAMAWIADSTLASAVSNAGGLGIIAAGGNTPENVRAEIRRAKELTDKPFAVNIMLLNSNADEVAKIVCEEGVKVVTTGAGSPGKYMDMWKSHGIKVIPVVASVALAKRMERSGADMVIAEGCEAGGHIGELTTMALVPQIVDAVNIPVIAAGGIADERGMMAALALGAKGFQVGTRFLVAKECTVHENYKQKVIDAKDMDSVVTGRSTGHPVRVLRNRLTREYIKLEKEGNSPEELESMGIGALRKAVVDGDINNGSVMAGQVAALVKKQESCEEIIKDFVEKTEKLVKVVGEYF